MNKSNKTDVADAEAICEAVQRPNMRFVPVKTQAQQTILSLHRARGRSVRNYFVLLWRNEARTVRPAQVSIVNQVACSEAWC
jgi:transposase